MVQPHRSARHRLSESALPPEQLLDGIKLAAKWSDKLISCITCLAGAEALYLDGDRSGPAPNAERFVESMKLLRKPLFNLRLGIDQASANFSRKPVLDTLKTVATDRLKLAWVYFGGRPFITAHSAILAVGRHCLHCVPWTRRSYLEEGDWSDGMTAELWSDVILGLPVWESLDVDLTHLQLRAEQEALSAMAFVEERMPPAGDGGIPDEKTRTANQRAYKVYLREKRKDPALGKAEFVRWYNPKQVKTEDKVGEGSFRRHCCEQSNKKHKRAPRAQKKSSA